MLATRFLSRTLPRVATRALAPRALPRSITAATYSNSLSRPSAIKNFSTSLWRREPAGENDQVLSAKLEHERSLEAQGRDPSVLPEDIDYFVKNSPFKIEDKPGSGVFTLTRQMGNETIKIEINVSDINEIDEDFDGLEEDNALEDEDFTPSKQTINQSGVKGGKVDVAPEDRLAPSDQEGELDEEVASDSFPVNLLITITKPGAGATLIRARIEDQAIEVENINYFASADLIEPKSTEQIREAQSVYEAPPFDNLDQELQSMIYQYLEDRGIDTELAVSLPEYVNFKEQREYVQWLDNMKKFIDA